MRAMKEKKKIQFINQSTRLGKEVVLFMVCRLKYLSAAKVVGAILVFIMETRNRFINHRLDYIKSVEILDSCETYDTLEKSE